MVHRVAPVFRTRSTPYYEFSRLIRFVACNYASRRRRRRRKRRRAEGGGEGGRKGRKGRKGRRSSRRKRRQRERERGREKLGAKNCLTNATTLLVSSRRNSRVSRGERSAPGGGGRSRDTRADTCADVRPASKAALCTISLRVLQTALYRDS